MGTTTLIQNSAGEILTYVETLGGTAFPGLSASDVNVDIKKSNASTFINSPRTDTDNASADIGSGANGTVSVQVPGSVGNTYTVEVVAPGSGTNDLTVSVLGTAITVTLAATAGVLDADENTATLVAAAIDANVANAFGVASGTGADPLTASEGPTALSGGTDGDWTDLGNGFYSIGLASTDTDVLGAFYLRVSAPTLRPALEVAQIVTSVVATPPTVTAPDVTVLTGTVLDQDGNGRSGIAVTAQVLSTPTVVAGVGVTTSLIVERTDANGQFTLTLLTGAQVDVAIPAMNYRRTLTVPSTSQNLFLIP